MEFCGPTTSFCKSTNVHSFSSSQKSHTATDSAKHWINIEKVDDEKERNGSISFLAVEDGIKDGAGDRRRL